MHNALTEMVLSTARVHQVSPEIPISSALMLMNVQDTMLVVKMLFARTLKALTPVSALKAQLQIQTQQFDALLSCHVNRVAIVQVTQSATPSNAAYAPNPMWAMTVVIHVNTWTAVPIHNVDWRKDKRNASVPMDLPT